MKTDQILEIGGVKVTDGKITDTFSALVHPTCPIPEEITKLTGITEEMAALGEPVEKAMEDFLIFSENLVFLGHNLSFDYSFLKQAAVNMGKKLDRKGIDTLSIARKFLPSDQKKTLAALKQKFGIETKQTHRAYEDALAAALIYEKLKEQYGEKEPETFYPRDFQIRIKKQTPATPVQVAHLKEFFSCYKLENEEKQIHWETLTKSEASRTMDLLIQKYGKIKFKEKSRT